MKLNHDQRKIAPHRKTRAGCETCKRRHVKCDEARPACRKCLIKGRACNYQYNLPSYPVFGLDALTGADAFRFCTRDLELIHHWVTVTIDTIGGTKEIRAIGRTVLTADSWTKPYLLHVILAVSALHLARLKPGLSSIYTRIARHHYSIGLPLFRDALQDLNRSNCHALYACAHLIAKFSQAIEQRPSWPIFSHEKHSGANWILLQHGAYSIVESNRRMMWQGPMSCLAERPLDSTSTIMSAEVADKMDYISKIIEQSRDETCISAWNLLKQIFALDADPDCGANAKCLLQDAVARIPMPFFTLTRERKPEAIIILAHYCIFWEKINSDAFWYVKNWSRLIFNECLRNLGHEWHKYLVWPASIVEKSSEPQYRAGQSSDWPSIDTMSHETLSDWSMT